MLPGLIYYDLAYDTQRSYAIEWIISLLPPSGAAILLRLCFSNEAVGIPVGWFHKAPVSNTTAISLIGFLWLNCIIWIGIAILYVNRRDSDTRMHQLRTHTIPTTPTSTLTPTTTTNTTTGPREFRNQTFRTRVDKAITYVWSLISRPSLKGYTKVPDQLHDEHTLESPLNTDSSIIVTNLTKHYHTGSESICVLDNINMELASHQVTVLLGSNGAGKTTLMRILSGLDSLYSGIVEIIVNNSNRGSNKRIIGWCPQSDPLYGHLTVNEHLELFEYLIECMSNTSYSSYSIHDRIQITLQSLGMIEYRYTKAMYLSGGMKRRLSLALAFVGSPSILLLDEPTSGCDSWTRELVRRDILSRKATTSIIVSTHHSDDVEVLADKIWFLNEKHLVLNKNIEELFNDNNTTSNTNNDSNNNSNNVNINTNRLQELFNRRPLKFSTTTLFVKSQFIRFFGEGLSLALQPIGMLHDNPPYSWIIPSSYFRKLIGFVRHLDNLQEQEWTLEHLTVFSAISSYYGKPVITERYQSEETTSEYAHFHGKNKVSSSNTNTTTYTTTTNNTDSYGYNMYNYVISKLNNIIVLLKIRYIDLKKHSKGFYLSHLLLPFFVAYFLALGCRDISYPKVRITSANLHSIGEVPVSVGPSPTPLTTTTTTTTINRAAMESPLLNATIPKDMISILANLSITNWRGYINSDTLWNELYSEYYQHNKNRWGAVVINDYSSDWLESSLLINQNTMNLSPLIIKNELNTFCNSSDLNNNFCNEFSIQLQSSSSSNDDNGMISVIVASHQSITTNFTLLSNVTSDHAAPVFIKEVLAPIASIITDSAMDNNVNRNITPIYSQYDLFSYPLPNNNIMMNKHYLERGYLGSTLITMYLLMTIVSCVKFITKLNGTRIKRQLHGVGILPYEYWLSNWLFDVIKIFIAELFILLGIYYGGNPISDYFLGISSVLTILACLLFSMSVVSSSYVMIMLWDDPLASQLFILLTTISGGIFLKMYLDRHHSLLYTFVTNICILISPAFAFTTIMFDIFKTYTHSMIQTRLMISNKHNNMIIYEMLTRSRYCCFILLLQTLIYLVLCILIDTYQIQILHYIKTLRYKLSAQWMCNDINTMLRDSEAGIMQQHGSSGMWGRTPFAHASIDNNDDSNSITSSNDNHSDNENENTFNHLTNWHDPLYDMTIQAGNRMRDQLTSHPDYRNGIFPFVTRSAYKSAISIHNKKHYHAIDSDVVHDIVNDVNTNDDSSNGGDIEMTPLSPSSSPLTSIYSYDEMIECNNICVDSYDTTIPSTTTTTTIPNTTSKLSLCNVTFKLPISSRVAIMSMNGGGKTTLFEVLTGLRLPIHGNVKLFGYDIISDYYTIGCKNLIGYVPQDDSLLDFLTVQETIEIFHSIESGDYHRKGDQYGKGDQYPIPSSLQGNNFLSNKYNQYPIYALSGGTKKKLSLLLANLHHPKLLLLDECTTGIDPISSTSIIDYLQHNINYESNVNKSQGLLFTSHRVDEAFTLCNEIIMLIDGQIFMKCPSIAFIDLIHRYYQVDVYINVEYTDDNVRDIQEAFLSRLYECIGGKSSIERIVIYGSLLRLTFRKLEVPVTKLWNKLDMWRYHGIIKKYMFRAMELEEILATILVASKYGGR